VGLGQCLSICPSVFFFCILGCYGAIKIVLLLLLLLYGPITCKLEGAEELK